MAVPTGPQVKGLDVGTGASFVYPLVGAGAYGWSFVASDVDPSSVTAAKRNLDANLAAATAATAAVAVGSAVSIGSRRRISSSDSGSRVLSSSENSSGGAASQRLAAGLAASVVRLQRDPRHTLQGVLLDQEEVHLYEQMLFHGCVTFLMLYES
jgi:ribosomal protein L11 methylase PrmA